MVPQRPQRLSECDQGDVALGTASAGRCSPYPATLRQASASLCCGLTWMCRPVPGREKLSEPALGVLVVRGTRRTFVAAETRGLG